MVWLHVRRNGQPSLQQRRRELLDAWVLGHLSHKVDVYPVAEGAPCTGLDVRAGAVGSGSSEAVKKVGCPYRL